MKKALLTVVSIVLAFTLAACGASKNNAGSASSSPAPASSAPASASASPAEEFKSYTWTTKKGEFKLAERIQKKAANGEKLVFRNSFFSAASPYAEEVRKGIADAASELGIDYKMIGPTDGSAEKQIAELETLIDSEQVDGLVVASGDADTIMPVLKKAWDKGIPVITIDLDSAESHRLAFVGVSLEDVGMVGAEAFVKLHPEKTGKIALFAAFPENVYARVKFEAIQKVLERDNYNMEVVGPFGLGLDMSVGYGVVENAFTGNKDITAVYVADEYVEVAARYVKTNNLSDKVIVIGNNTFEVILNYLKEGVIDQTTGYNPPGQGYEAAKILYNFIKEGKTTDEIINVPAEDVNASNIDQYLK